MSEGPGNFVISRYVRGCRYFRGGRAAPPRMLELNAFRRLQVNPAQPPQGVRVSFFDEFRD